MAAPLASRTQLEEGLGVEPIVGLDATRADAVLARVSSLVRSYAGRMWEAEDPPDAVVTVVLDVAQRVYLNPRNTTTTGNGEFAATYAIVGLSLTDEEKRAIDQAVGRRRGSLRSIETTRGDPVCVTGYVPTGPPPSGYDFPWYALDPDGTVAW